MKTTTWIIPLALLCSMNALTAQATVTSYTTRASFAAAAGPTTTENFDEYLVDARFHTVPVDVGDFVISMTGSPDNHDDSNFIDVAPAFSAESDVNGTTNMRVVTDGSPQADLFFTFDAPIVAFGADFRSLNDTLVRTQILVAGNNLVPPVQPNTNTLTFFGFTSTVPFTTVRFSGVRTDVYGIDNVSYAVPEPTTFALVAPALLAGIRRRTLV